MTFGSKVKRLNRYATFARVTRAEKSSFEIKRPLSPCIKGDTTTHGRMDGNNILCVKRGITNIIARAS